MKRGAGIPDDILGVDGSAGRVFFYHIRPVFVENFGEPVDGVRIQAGSGDEVHRAHVHAFEGFGLTSIRIGRDGGGKKKG